MWVVIVLQYFNGNNCLVDYFFIDNQLSDLDIKSCK
jgi:hypothetical protein